MAEEDDVLRTNKTGVDLTSIAQTQQPAESFADQNTYDLGETAVELTPEEDRERQYYIDMLNQIDNFKHLGRFVRGKGFKIDYQTIKDKNIDELARLYTEVMHQIGMRDTGGMIPTAIDSALKATEFISTRILGQPHLRGLAQNAAKDDGFQQSIEEVQLHHQLPIEMDYRQRFAFNLGRVAVQTAYNNNAEKTNAPLLAKQVGDDVAAKYAGF